MRSTRYLVGAVALLAVASTAPQAAQAQAYPTQDVHFVCAFAAGSGADIIVRYFSDKMRPLMGRSIIVLRASGLHQPRSRRSDWCEPARAGSLRSPAARRR